MRTVKVGDILTIYPSKCKTKVIVVTAEKINLKESDERYWLKDYWKEKHEIILPVAFRIITCKFTTTYKEYDYPLCRKCVKKPLRQKKLKERWKNKRKAVLNAKVSRFDIDKLLGVNQEDLSKEEMSDNKGNWHPPSDYTMYQMGF